MLDGTIEKDVPDLSSPADSDFSALAEANAFEAGDYESLKKRKDFKRTQSFHDRLHEILMFMVGFFALILTFAVTFWAWHMLTPESMHFLSVAQVDKIQTTFMSAAVSAILAVVAQRKYLETK
jgi:uncharacterized membrane protein